LLSIFAGVPKVRFGPFADIPNPSDEIRFPQGKRISGLAVYESTPWSAAPNRQHGARRSDMPIAAAADVAALDIFIRAATNGF
jgi:hypothetical protein